MAENQSVLCVTHHSVFKTHIFYYKYKHISPGGLLHYHCRSVLHSCYRMLYGLTVPEPGRTVCAFDRRLETLRFERAVSPARSCPVEQRTGTGLWRRRAQTSKSPRTRVRHLRQPACRAKVSRRKSRHLDPQEVAAGPPSRRRQRLR